MGTNRFKLCNYPKSIAVWLKKSNLYNAIVHETKEMWISVCLLACFKMPLIYSNKFFVLLLLGEMVSRTLCVLVGFSITKRHFRFFVPNSLTDFLGIQHISQFFRELLSDGMENQHVLLLS